MCGYMGSELVEIAKQVAAKEHELAELLRQEVQYEIEHKLPSNATSAYQALVRSGDFLATGIFARVRKRVREELESEALTPEVAYPE